MVIASRFVSPRTVHHEVGRDTATDLKQTIAALSPSQRAVCVRASALLRDCDPVLSARDVSLNVNTSVSVVPASMTESDAWLSVSQSAGAGSHVYLYCCGATGGDPFSGVSSGYGWHMSGVTDNVQINGCGRVPGVQSLSRAVLCGAIDALQHACADAHVTIVTSNRALVVSGDRMSDTGLTPWKSARKMLSTTDYTLLVVLHCLIATRRRNSFSVVFTHVTYATVMPALKQASTLAHQGLVVCLVCDSHFSRRQVSAQLPHNGGRPADGGGADCFSASRVIA